MATINLSYLGKRTIKTADSSFDSFRYLDDTGRQYSSYEELVDGDKVAASQNSKGFWNLAKVLGTLKVNLVEAI